MQTESPVVFSTLNAIGVARLENPKVLNSLNLAMVRMLAEQLAEWEADPAIAAIVIHSDLEKAFCAGGDVKTVALRLLQDKNDPYPGEFFRWEYKMDHMIHACRKPVLVWGDGIVMGGGMGIFCGASHGIVTERAMLAMPEISIGFFPDVGAGYFLNKLPLGVGLFLAWTAARLSAADALHLGFARVQIPAGRKSEVFGALAQAEWSTEPDENHRKMTEMLEPFRSPSGASQLATFESAITDAFAKDSALAVHEAFLASAPRASEWWAKARETYLAGSPLSAAIAFEQLRRARNLARLEIFVMEWGLARQISRRHEFPEGVRALLIDKDNRPKWTPARLQDVDLADVQAHFEPFPGTAEIREFFARKGV